MIVVSDRAPSDSAAGEAKCEAKIVLDRAIAELSRLSEALPDHFATSLDGRRELEEQLVCITASYQMLLSRQDDVRHLQNELHQVRSQLDATLRSASWRVTAPMRRVSRRMPGVARRLKQFVRDDRRLRKTAKWLWRKLRGKARRKSLSVSVSPGTVTPPLIPVRIAAAAAGERLPPVEDRLPQGHARRIVNVGHVLPYPVRAGNEYRIYRMLRWLAESGSDLLVVVCPLPGDEPTQVVLAQAAAVFPNLMVCLRTGEVYHNLPDDSSLLAALATCGGRDIPTELGEVGDRTARQAELLNIARTYCPDMLVDLLQVIDGSWRPQTLLAEYVFMTRPFSVLRRELVKIVDTHDVFSTMAEKVRAFGIDQMLRMEAAEESELLERSDVIIGIQPEETRELRRLVPNRQVITAGVDFPVEPGLTSQDCGHVVLLVASGNPMNVKGLRDFLRFCWPLVLDQVADAELRVVGTVGSSIEVVPPGVRILGRTPHLGRAYLDARVVINPAVAGTGLKIKTVEALAQLRPIVCFPAGVEGIVEEARQFCHVVNNWYEFSERLIQLLRFPPTREDAESFGKMLTDLLAPKRIYAELETVLNEKK